MTHGLLDKRMYFRKHSTFTNGAPVQITGGNQDVRQPLPPQVPLSGTHGCNTVFEWVKLENGRGERIRTSDPLLPKQVRYQAALRPDNFGEWPVRGERPWHQAVRGTGLQFA